MVHFVTLCIRANLQLMSRCNFPTTTESVWDLMLVCLPAKLYWLDFDVSTQQNIFFLRKVSDTLMLFFYFVLPHTAECCDMHSNSSRRTNSFERTHLRPYTLHSISLSKHFQCPLEHSFDSHLGHLTDAFVQSDLQVHLSKPVSIGCANIPDWREHLDSTVQPAVS